MTGGGQRLQPVFCIVCQASIALCRSIRRRVIGSGGCEAKLSKRQQQMQLQQQSRTSGVKKPSFMRTKRPTDLRIQQAGFLIPLFYLRESQIVSQSLGEWNLLNHEQALIDGSRSLLLENHGKNFPKQSPSRIAHNDARVFAAHAFL